MEGSDLETALRSSLRKAASEGCHTYVLDFADYARFIGRLSPKPTQEATYQILTKVINEDPLVRRSLSQLYVVAPPAIPDEGFKALAILMAPCFSGLHCKVDVLNKAGDRVAMPAAPVDDRTAALLRVAEKEKDRDRPAPPAGPAGLPVSSLPTAVKVKPDRDE